LPAFDYPARKYTHRSTNGAATSSSSNSSSSNGFSAVRSPEDIERYSSSTAATTHAATTATSDTAAAVTAATAALHSQTAELKQKLAKSEECNKLLQLKLRAASLAKPASHALQLQQQQQQLQHQQLQQHNDVQAAHSALQQWLSSSQATADAAAKQSAELKSEYDGMLIGGCTLKELTDRLEHLLMTSSELR
jgi:mRNA deadenylase 3'-5' endonuclease subunit Ccr4